MDSDGRTIGGVKLETIVYIGIAADIVLAVVVGVLLVWWRNNSKKRQEAKLQAARDAAADSRSDWATDGSVTPRQADRSSGQDHAHQRLASERMVSRSVRTEYTEVEADFGFLDDHQSGSQTSGRVVSRPRPHVVGASETRVSYHDVVNSEGQGGSAYAVANDERVVHNPLSASRKAVNTVEEELTDEHHVAKSVYYTYNDPPSLQPSRVSSSQEYSQPLRTSSAYDRRQEQTVVRESVTYVETRREEERDEHREPKTVYYQAEVEESGVPSSSGYLQSHHTSSAYQMEGEGTYENGVVRESVVSVETRKGEERDEHREPKTVYYQAEVDESGAPSSPEYLQSHHTSSAYRMEDEGRYENGVIRESVVSVETRKEEERDEHREPKTVYYQAEVDESGAPSSPEYLQSYHTSSAYEMEDEERYENGVVRESVASVESLHASPPPPPPPPPQVDQGVIVHQELTTTSSYSTLDSHAKVVGKEGDEVMINDMSEWAKMNFGYEEPEKRYIIQLEECTEVM